MPHGRRVALYLKALFFIALAPGTVTVGAPYLLLRAWPAPCAVGLASVLGLGLIVPGVAVLLRCCWDFAQVGRGTLSPVAPPVTVVRRGCYRYVRNPMYTGVLAILLGEALVFQSWALLGWAAVMGTAFHVTIVCYEEPTLQRHFGARYTAYRATVPRWLPRLRTRP